MCQGGTATGAFVVQSGVLRLVHVTTAGKLTVVRLLGPSGMVGLVETINAAPYLLGVETVNESRLEYLPRKAFMDFLADHPQAAFELLGWLARDHHQTLQESCRTMSKAPLPARLWGRLCRVGRSCGLATNEGIALSRHLTVQDLAYGLGCSRQWTSKLLGEFEGEGRITRRGRQIILHPTAVPGAVNLSSSARELAQSRALGSRSASAGHPTPCAERETSEHLMVARAQKAAIKSPARAARPSRSR